MPILLKNFKWSQSAEEVTIRVQFADRIPSSIDIFTHKGFVKINCPPFYFEKFLRHPIKENESRCRIMETEVIFHLKKLENIEWDSLEMAIAKHDGAKVKENVIKEVQEIGVQERKQRIEAKDAKKKEEIYKEIERDTKTRTIIENHNANICGNEISSIEKWKENKSTVATRVERDAYKDLFFRPAPVNVNNLTPRVKKPNPSRVFTDKCPNKLVNNVPQIRQGGVIKVDFTDRKFTTPSRESTAQEEMEWLTKQHEAQKATGFVEGDLRPEERNPMWLKEKGDEFFSKNNCLGAISAYSTAIRLSDKNYELYMNRSKAHFAIENYQKCAEDCSKALELLVPLCEANRMARIDCMSRRGVAVSHLGYTRQGLDELLMALKLNPTNDKIKMQAEMLRCKLENGEG